MTTKKALIEQLGKRIPCKCDTWAIANTDPWLMKYRQLTTHHENCPEAAPIAAEIMERSKRECLRLADEVERLEKQTDTAAIDEAIECFSQHGNPGGTCYNVWAILEILRCIRGKHS